MLECRLASDADFGWALERVREGHSVQVTVPHLGGTKSHRQRHSQQTQNRLNYARQEAWVSKLEYRAVGVRRRKRQITGFVISPRWRGEASGVREPRRPEPPVLPDLAAEAELP